MFECAGPAVLPDYQAGHGLGLARLMPNRRRRPIIALVRRLAGQNLRPTKTRTGPAAGVPS